MEKHIIEGYRYFDTFYTWKNIPHDLIQVWGHKERLKKVYILVDAEEKDEVKAFGKLDLEIPGVYIYDNYDSAKEEMNDWNNN